MLTGKITWLCILPNRSSKPNWYSWYLDNSNPRVGADQGVDFDWSRQSRDCPDVSAKILNSVQHCRCIQTEVTCKVQFLPRLHYDENSVCPSVCLSNACIMTKRKWVSEQFLNGTSAHKRKKDMFKFLYHTKDHLTISCDISETVRGRMSITINQ